MSDFIQASCPPSCLMLIPPAVERDSLAREGDWSAFRPRAQLDHARLPGLPPHPRRAWRRNRAGELVGGPVRRSGASEASSSARATIAVGELAGPSRFRVSRPTGAPSRPVRATTAKRGRVAAAGPRLGESSRSSSSGTACGPAPIALVAEPGALHHGTDRARASSPSRARVLVARRAGERPRAWRGPQRSVASAARLPRPTDQGRSPADHRRPPPANDWPSLAGESGTGGQSTAVSMPRARRARVRRPSDAGPRPRTRRLRARRTRRRFGPAPTLRTT